MLAPVALRCVAAFFILAAFSGFVRGIWRSLVFFAGSLHVGQAGIESPTFGYELGRAVGPLLAALLFGTIGSSCLILAKRFSARPRATHDAPHASVLYLRSFTADEDLSRRPRMLGHLLWSLTEEEQLVEALREVGPVVAIGRPGERLPRLGATRIYVDDEDWQRRIRSWFERAILVVIHVPSNPTIGVTWELERSLIAVPRSRLVLLLPKDSNALEWITWKLQEHGLTPLLPQELPHGPYRSSCSGFVHFTDDGKAAFSPLVKPPFFRRSFSEALVPVFRLALQPVIVRRVGCWKPLPLGFGNAALGAVCATFCAVVIAFGLETYWTTRVKGEPLIVDRELMDALPAETRQVVQGLDAAGLSAWMQSRFAIGLRYTPDEAVVSQAKTVSTVLAAAPVADCAAVANGTAGRPVLHSLLNQLGMTDPAALQAWVTFQRSVVLESLAGNHVAGFPLSEAEAAISFISLSARLSSADSERFQDIGQRFERATADHQCWFTRTLFAGVDLLEEPLRSKLARVALGQETER